MMAISKDTWKTDKFFINKSIVKIQKNNWNRTFVPIKL